VLSRPYRKLAQSGDGMAKLLGDLEREIMELMWQRGQAPVRSVLEAVNGRRSPDRALAYTTVMTVMAKLAQKGLLQRQRVGRADEYHVTETREAFLRRSSEHIARQLVEDFGDAAISSFVDVLETVAPEQLERLRRKAQDHGQA
jgi:predicted transcriptional regulator